MKLTEDQFQLFIDSIITIAAKVDSQDERELKEIERAISSLRKVLASPSATKVSTIKRGDKVKTSWSSGTVAVVGRDSAYVVYDGLAPLGDWFEMHRLMLLSTQIPAYDLKIGDVVKTHKGQGKITAAGDKMFFVAYAEDNTDAIGLWLHPAELTLLWRD
jgi:hypothetical protein